MVNEFDETEQKRGGENNERQDCFIIITSSDKYKSFY